MSFYGWFLENKNRINCKQKHGNIPKKPHIYTNINPLKIKDD
jgi:hypothetical protein